MSDVRKTLAGMRKAQEYLDGKRTRGEDSIIRDLLSAVEKVLALCDEHERIEKRNERVPLSRISDLEREPTATQYRKALTDSLGGVN